MTTRDLTKILPQENRFERSQNRPARSWAPPLAPVGTGHVLNGEDTHNAVTRDKHTLRFRNQNVFPKITASFQSRRKLIAGVATVVALGTGALAWFWGSPSEQTSTPSAQPALTAQSLPVASVDASPSVLETSIVAPPAAASADLPVSGAAAQPSNATASPQAAPVALSETTPASQAGPVALSETVPASQAAPVALSETTPASQAGPATTPASQTAVSSQNRDVVFLQRPGVNIRSTPSATSKVLGTAPKGKRFEVTNREGEWVQVESGRLKGWINSQFLAPSGPR
jgi:hypothetical protein